MKGRKTLSVLAIFGLIVGAPAISYFYLNSGLDYRLDILEELKPQGKVEPFKIISDSSLVLGDKELLGKVSVLGFLSEEKMDGEFEKLSSYFKGTKSFQLRTLVSSDNSRKERRTANWDVAFLEEPLFLEFKNKMVGVDPSLAKEEIFVLLDTLLNIRHVYPLNEDFEIGHIVEHIPVLVPRVKNSDIILKRSKDDE